MRGKEDIVTHIGYFTQSAMQEKYRNKPTISINEAFQMMDTYAKEVVESDRKHLVDYLNKDEHLEYDIHAIINAPMIELK